MSDDRNPETNGMRIPKPLAGTVYTPGVNRITGEKVWTEQVQVYVTGARRPAGRFVGRDTDTATFTVGI